MHSKELLYLLAQAEIFLPCSCTLYRFVCFTRVCVMLSVQNNLKESIVRVSYKLIGGLPSCYLPTKLFVTSWWFLPSPMLFVVRLLFFIFSLDIFSATLSSVDESGDLSSFWPSLNFSVLPFSSLSFLLSLFESMLRQV